METKVDQRKQKYIIRVKDLYDQVKKWIKAKKLIAKEKEVELNEEMSGIYKVPGLLIEDKEGKKIAELQPAGAWIIGAEGRVDIIGIIDRAYLVYLQIEGPHMKMSVSSSAEKVEEISRPLFKGVDQPGWYWIENKPRGKARLVDSELFIDLLSEVSDYEL
ncbi:MAG: hypothetical protein JW787_12025 [Sedimentisphaerales bacterium]|nr:hypothetical protein [Sedimentisphaerales bacterium]